MRKTFARAPRAVRIASSAAILLAALALLNIAYHVIRKRVFYRTGYARGWPRRRVTPGPSSVIGTAWLT
ncbi:hypothetical protein ACFLEY_20780 [Bradyrhizobium sp. YCK136]|uniref:hypothetical protein n=1 Tax=Bradyrhizobium sp. YCK136 TaxID=3351346 RepID=UPI0037C72191